MIEFLKNTAALKPTDSVSHRMIDGGDDETAYRMTCDGCGEAWVVVTDQQPMSVLQLMLQIEGYAMDHPEERIQGEFCVLVKREYNKDPDYKILCPSCESDEECRYRAVDGPDPRYVRLKDDAAYMTDVPWEEWSIPSQLPE